MKMKRAREIRERDEDQNKEGWSRDSCEQMCGNSCR